MIDWLEHDIQHIRMSLKNGFTEDKWKVYDTLMKIKAMRKNNEFWHGVRVIAESNASDQGAAK